MVAPKYKVLLIEDDKIEQEMFRRFVDAHTIPFDYVIAGSVKEARDALNKDHFDVVITDHHIGDGTGFDILALVKDSPVIVVTGAGDEETAIRAMKEGACDYLVKDLEQNYLKVIPITVEHAIKHKAVEKKLQLLSGAIMSTEDSVYITDMGGLIIFVNKAFCRTYGYKEQEILGLNSNTLWIGREQAENTRSVFQTRCLSSEWEVGFYHKRKDGSIFPVSLSRSTIKDTNKIDVAIVGVSRDISEQMLVEDELRNTSLQLQKRVQQLSENAVTAAQTVKNLLIEGQIDQAIAALSEYIELSSTNAGKLELQPQTSSSA
jgi:PAS domain S-box-containing protein